MMQRRLFIGGAADGRWSDVNEDASHWRATNVPPFPGRTQTTPESLVKFDDYRPVPFRIEGETVVIMVEEKMSARAAFARLLNNYRPGPRKERST